MTALHRTQVVISYTDGSAVVESWLKLSGRELLRGIKEGTVAPAPVFDALNMQVDSFGDGWAQFSLEPKEYMFNLAGTLHGGVLATLLDSVLTCAYLTRVPAGIACTTSDFQVRFFRPVRVGSGTLMARGEVINAGKTLATTVSSVRNPAGKLIAYASATLVVGPAEKFLLPR